MNRKNSYFQRIREEEVEALRGYDSFLSVFYKNLTADRLDEYAEQERCWIGRLEKIRRVMEKMAIEPLSGEREILLENSRRSLKNISHSLDRMKGALHDDISSLNKKNDRMGLRYNRYGLRPAKPGMIDITT